MKSKYTVSEIVAKIQNEFKLVYSPNVLRITLNDQTEHIGFFTYCEDSHLLEPKNIFRFVTKNKVDAYNTEMKENGGISKSTHTMTIDAGSIYHIELVNMFTKEPVV